MVWLSAWNPASGFQAGIKIFADTSTFTYDLEGKLKTAKNRDAYIARTYFINGRLKTDTSKIAVYDRVETPTSTPYNSHVYAFNFTYDRNGRRKTRNDPANLGGGQQTLVYHPQLGALQTLTDRALAGGATHSASFVYDARARLTSRTTGAGTVTESWVYDNDDRVTTRLDEVIGEVYEYDGRGKREKITITGSIQGLDETVTHTYDGIGALSLLQSTKGSGILDAYSTDALGNVTATDGLYGDTHSKYTYDRPGLAGVPATIFEDRLSGNPPSDTIADDTYIGYDLAGNEESTLKWVWFWNGNWNAPFWPSKGTTWTWNAYGADERLRVAQRSWNDVVTGQRKHSFVEHRYDALGRRVLTRTQADSACTLPEPECMSTMDRFVWDGDQLLIELRAKMPYTTHGWSLEVEESGGNFYGKIRYAHADDMDRPVLFWQDNGTAIVPHWNFRGMAVWGSDPISGTPLQNMSWPGRDRGAYFGADTRITPTIPTHWQGSLTDGQGDGTGLLYRRNRYFNPSTAQFTQEDPIGLAGGLNLYGYANGDPVNFSDPFGLCPWCAIGYAAFELGSSLYDVYDLAKAAVGYKRGSVSGAELSVTAAGVGAGLAFFGGGYGRASREALEAGFKGATNVAEQVAFQSLAGGVGAGKGIVLAGGASKNAFRGAADFATAHGGNAADYVKKSTTASVTSAGGSKVHQVHWVENLKTGQIFDAKLTTTARR
jgi:RHS repeat-associated protein